MWLNYSQRNIFREIYKFLKSQGFTLVDSVTRKDIESIARSLSESEYLSESFYAVYKASTHDISAVIDNQLVHLDNLERYTIIFTVNEKLKALMVEINTVPLGVFSVKSEDHSFDIDMNIGEFLADIERQVYYISLDREMMSTDLSSIDASDVGSALISHYQKYREDRSVKIQTFSKHVSDIKKRFTDKHNANNLHNITKMLEKDGYVIPPELKQRYCEYYDPINPIYFATDQPSGYHFTKISFISGSNEKLELIIDIPRTFNINRIEQINDIPVYTYLSIIQHSYLVDKIIWELSSASDNNDILDHLFEPLLKNKYKGADFVRFNNVEEAMKILDECVAIYTSYKNTTDEIVEVGS